MAEFDLSNFDRHADEIRALHSELNSSALTLLKAAAGLGESGQAPAHEYDQWHNAWRTELGYMGSELQALASDVEEAAEALSRLDDDFAAGFGI